MSAGKLLDIRAHLGDDSGHDDYDGVAAAVATLLLEWERGGEGGVLGI
jgi:hypothetical protein